LYKSAANSTANENKLMLQYILNFDGIAAVAKIIDILVGNTISLNNLTLEMPECYLKKVEMGCEFKEMGKVIRLLSESYKNNSDLYEGIKIKTKKGWTLILPDNEKPVFNIYTEGYSSEYAEEISAQIKEKLETFLSK
jgi:mannose-1-phosphate guanylyltransferase/phosphomannomutase